MDGVEAPLIVRLSDALDRSLVGGKAAELARLMANGFDVPDGFVVTTVAHRLAAGDGEVPERVRSALKRALENHPGPLAYRSSGIAEDLASASFAGQYESVLDVRGFDAGIDALRACWRSGRVEHLDAYRDDMAAGSTAEMAVLVHGMVAAEVAGVAFSADPVTGASHVVVEATRGIGERLLSGEVTPERWIGSGDTLNVERTSSGPVLTEAQARAVVAMVHRAADLYDHPQDIEWAVAGDSLYVLQARPVTALPIEPIDRPPEGQTWLLSDGFFPEPILPLSFTTWLPRHSESWRRVFEKFGVPVETVGHARYFGRVYDRMIPLGSPAKDRPLPPRPILKLAVRLAPPFRNRLAVAREVVEKDLLAATVDEWESAGRTRLRGENRRLRAIDLSTLDDDALADHLDTVLEHVLASGVAHFEVASATFASAGHLGMLMEELLGWSAGRVADLVQGFGHASTEDGRALREAARAVENDPNLSEFLSDPERLVADAGPAGEAVRAFLDLAGYRSVGQDLSQPTWSEDPAPVVSLIRHYLDHEETASDPRAAAFQAEEEARREIENSQDWEAFAQALERARRFRPYGDETEPDVAAAMGLVRFAALEAAERLKAGGVIQRSEDVFYFEIDELIAALRSGEADVDIDRRSGEHRWALANPAPRLLGPEPAASPPLDVFPASTRPLVGAFLWAVDNAIGVPDVEGSDGEEIRGLAASPGRVTGSVRIIRSPAEFDRVRAGDIVVCTMTMAAWSPIFPVISGLITEQGGPLSHPATLAREYGLPAVLGVADATEIFEDGQRVTIDGGTGTVERA